MEGEFLVQEEFGVRQGIGGGNLLILGRDEETALGAAEAAVDAIRPVPGVVLPFPGGIVRAGSKVGAKHYAKMVASTNDAYCPTLRGRVETQLVDGATAVLEIVIDGISESAVGAAMAAALQAAAGEGVLAIGAGNYGGKLGKFHFKLHELGVTA